MTPEPENQYDPNAIRLDVVNGSQTFKVGYIPRNFTHLLNTHLRAGRKVFAKVVAYDMARTETHLRPVLEVVTYRSKLQASAFNIPHPATETFPTKKPVRQILQ